MALRTRMLKHRAVYWLPAGVDRFGKASYGDPVEVKCRWDEDTSMPFDDTGKPVVFRAMVWLPLDLPEGALLVRGTLSSIGGSGTAPTQEARRVQRIEKFDNLRASQTYRIAYLGDGTTG